MSKPLEKKALYEFVTRVMEREELKDKRERVSLVTFAYIVTPFTVAYVYGIRMVQKHVLTHPYVQTMLHVNRFMMRLLLPLGFGMLCVKPIESFYYAELQRIYLTVDENERVKFERERLAKLN